MGTTSKEFKQKQKQIKENRRQGGISAGPQSHILEGVSWDEAQKLQVSILIYSFLFSLFLFDSFKSFSILGRQYEWYGRSCRRRRCSIERNYSTRLPAPRYGVQVTTMIRQIIIEKNFHHDLV